MSCSTRSLAYLLFFVVGVLGQDSPGTGLDTPCHTICALYFKFLKSFKNVLLHVNTYRRAGSMHGANQDPMTLDIIHLSCHDHSLFKTPSNASLLVSDMPPLSKWGLRVIAWQCTRLDAHVCFSQRQKHDFVRVLVLVKHIFAELTSSSESSSRHLKKALSGWAQGKTN